MNIRGISSIVNSFDGINPKSFWFWVANKKYYLDNGDEREILEPMVAELSWTCHEETQKGDLVFLYRTSPKSDVKYLIQATSNAYEVVEGDEFSGWHHCDCNVLYKFENSLLSKDMKLNEVLMKSQPVKRNYQGNKGSFELNENEWFEINEMILKRNEDYIKFINSLIQKYPQFTNYFPNIIK